MKLILREKVGYITAIFRIAIYGLYVKEEIISLASEWQNVTNNVTLTLILTLTLT
jgi:hypothetical protein